MAHKLDFQTPISTFNRCYINDPGFSGEARTKALLGILTPDATFNLTVDDCGIERTGQLQIADLIATICLHFSRGQFNAKAPTLQNKRLVSDRTVLHTTYVSTCFLTDGCFRKAKGDQTFTLVNTENGLRISSISLRERVTVEIIRAPAIQD